MFKIPYFVLAVSRIWDTAFFVNIHQNYKTNLKVGQRVNAGEVVGVFDKHVRIGADLVCIGAFADGVSLETSEYIKMPD